MLKKKMKTNINTGTRIDVVPDEYVGQEPDDIPEEVVAVEEESL